MKAMGLVGMLEMGMRGNEMAPRSVFVIPGCLSGITTAQWLTVAPTAHDWHTTGGAPAWDHGSLVAPVWDATGA